MPSRIEWTEETVMVDRNGRRRRIYRRKTDGPTKRLRRRLRALGFAWCRHCEQWLPATSVRSGLCRDGRNALYRSAYAAAPDSIRQRVYARTRGLDPISVDGLEILTELWGGVCAYCEAPGTTWDHVIPVTARGLTSRSNIVPACRSCNSRKRNFDPLPWVLRGLAVHPEQWTYFLEFVASMDDNLLELVAA